MTLVYDTLPCKRCGEYPWPESAKVKGILSGRLLCTHEECTDSTPTEFYPSWAGAIEEWNLEKA